MKNYLYLLLIVVLLTTVACSDNEERNTINVQGFSELTYEPDQAEVWIGISVLKESAEESQNEVNLVTKNIVDELKLKSFNKIQTETLTLYEEKEWTQDEGSISKGWRATQTLKVKTSDMDKVGEIIDISVSNGANQINNINFGLTEAKEREYKQQAIAEASKDARAKAQTMAESLDVKLGDIISVSEGSFNYIPYRYDMKSSLAGDMVQEAAVIMPQEINVNANVNLVYEIK